MKNRKFAKVWALLLTVCMLFAALPVMAGAEEADDSGLMVGVGIESITPTSDMYPLPWGGGNRGYVFIGATEYIYVRVIAVSNAGEDVSPENISLIVSFETGKGPNAPEFIELLSEETGVPEENIFWSSTHVHSTPEITSSDWKDYLDIEIDTDDPSEEKDLLCKKNLAKWGAMCQVQLVAAAQAAIESMTPAEVSLATTTSYINVNRDTQYDSEETTKEGYNGQGFSDKTLTVIEFRTRDEEKKPIAFITHYAMHNTLLYANDYFNPDYNEVHGVKVADESDIEEGIYDVDDISNTVLSSKLELNVAYCDTYEKNYRSFESLSTEDNVDGAVAANAAVHPDIGGLVSQYIENEYEGSVAIWLSGAAGDQNPILRNTMNFESPITGEVLEIPVDGGFLESAVYYASIQFVDVKRAIAEMEEEDSFESDTPVSMAWDSDVVEPIDELNSDGEPYNEIPISLTVLRIGDIVLAGFPGELYNAIGVAMRDESDLEGVPSENILVVNHCWTHDGEARSYYPDDVAISNNSYNWGNSVKYPEGVINGAMIDLLEEVWEEAEPEE